MKKGAIRSRGTAAICIVVLATACRDAALANPVPPAYQDFPVAPSAFVSHVPTPLIADDFEPGVGGHIEFLRWWGSAATSSTWQLTLYSNTDADPESPDDAGVTAVVNAIAKDEGGGLFRYEAFGLGEDWTLKQGEPYWLSVANLGDGWTWALGDGVPDDTPGLQHQSAVRSLSGTPPWEAVAPASNLAFSVWARPITEPGTWVLLMMGVIGVGLSSRWGGGSPACAGRTIEPPR
jgi:hypothetical protein